MLREVNMELLKKDLTRYGRYATYSQKHTDVRGTSFHPRWIINVRKFNYKQMPFNKVMGK